MARDEPGDLGGAVKGRGYTGKEWTRVGPIGLGVGLGGKRDEAR